MFRNCRPIRQTGSGCAEYRLIIDRASFFFTRDTISRDYLKAQAVKTPILEFGPDAQLGMHLRDDAKVKSIMAFVEQRQKRMVDAARAAVGWRD